MRVRVIKQGPAPKLLKAVFALTLLVLAIFAGDLFFNQISYITAAGVTLTVYVNNPDVPGDDGGGGGGGSGGPSVPTTVIFSGLAYPAGRITLLVDSQPGRTVTADSRGRWQLRLTGANAGIHTFSFAGRDSRGRYSPFFSLVLDVPPRVITTVSGIFLAPTVSLDKKEVARGNPLMISGQTVPGARINLRLNGLSVFAEQEVADAAGQYTYELDTIFLSYGEYGVQTRAWLPFEQLVSEWSQLFSFIVGEKDVLWPEDEICPPRADLNNDCRVNLVDLSILVYWLDRANPPAEVDLNGDGLIDLADFSVAAYYWTG